MVLKPTINDSAPIIPDESARVTLPNPTLVLSSSSGTVGSTGKSIPITNATIRAVNIPTIEVFKASFSSLESPNTFPRAQATLGPNMGATTMAPIITATLLFIIPMAATNAERTISKR